MYLDYPRGSARRLPLIEATPKDSRNMEEKVIRGKDRELRQRRERVRYSLLEIGNRQNPIKIKEIDYGLKIITKK
jgi:hypothetical protein